MQGCPKKLIDKLVNNLELYINHFQVAAQETPLVPKTLPDYDVFLGGIFLRT